MLTKHRKRSWKYKPGLGEDFTFTKTREQVPGSYELKAHLFKSNLQNSEKNSPALFLVFSKPKDTNDFIFTNGIYHG